MNAAGRAAEGRMTMSDGAALTGLKVVEFAHIIAGPLAGALIGDLGAEVVHVEDPRHGDPHRTAGPAKDGVPLWWKVAGRNKRSVTADLRTDAGRDLAHRLAAWADVVITNFRGSTLTGWGLDWPALHALNPALVMLQISGFGAGSGRADEPGLGKVAEAMSGVVARPALGDRRAQRRCGGHRHRDLRADSPEPHRPPGGRLLIAGPGPEPAARAVHPVRGRGDLSRHPKTSAPFLYRKRHHRKEIYGQHSPCGRWYRRGRQVGLRQRRAAEGDRPADPGRSKADRPVR
jgi:hypothetical protein